MTQDKQNLGSAGLLLPQRRGGMCPNDKAECSKNFTYTQLPAVKRNNTRKQERKGRAPA